MRPSTGYCSVLHSARCLRFASGWRPVQTAARPSGRGHAYERLSDGIHRYTAPSEREYYLKNEAAPSWIASRVSVLEREQELKRTPKKGR